MPHDQVRRRQAAGGDGVHQLREIASRVSVEIYPKKAKRALLRAGMPRHLKTSDAALARNKQRWTARQLRNNRKRTRQNHRVSSVQRQYCLQRVA